MDNSKELVGRQAARYVEDGMVVGLGTGSTAYWFVDEVGQRIKRGELQHIVGVPTSKQTEIQARELGIPLSTLDEVNHIDLLVDGADECLSSFNGIKGGGGALLIEKIVAQNSRQIIWIVTEEKLVEKLGRFPLPVEIVQTGSWKLFRVFDEAGMHPAFRKKGKDSLFVTDSGNYIIDLHLNQIDNPQQLAFELKTMVGVVDHGLFLNYPDIILVGKQDGTILTIER
ncbi:ribose-5-phosphate isomerase RpiA [Tuanshanicoccus lijuaniae]|uniref:ribose-5-phosphate isomerase RpiA n=1 Tax=Aerococcaceae bacterium zg-1292 TaxID=2774330 RepID=UPI001938B055|nr:ribose-5-phosphate isomerase RpiA [Aerococcaceae bacterium zg-1292]MBF6978983.1 ribose-5-phosphate isomerase RpiA [Aerococcaceae bacterium zg-BR22]MBS4455419.1 ribose-5-phosphate isomerase RpiA [Aerococcaceae bacterium zg-A91]MBS4457379.1 ribose-5-phosphate isomerase RpiA [Aerococcaceae bacterium zg-BR33]QQA36932.1 ribose-5-phosphate isomerase RpiA [Aerococcaceae bacterium zg-1292]